MVAGAGELHQAHVALEHDGLGLDRDAAEPEARGELALVHHAFADQGRVLGVMDDERVEIAHRSSRGA